MQQVDKYMSGNEVKLELLKKKFRSLLNKITAENFEHLAKEARDPRQYQINDNESLQSVR